MEKIINRVSKQLVNVSSRRGFLSTLAKATIATSGAIAAARGAEIALAAGQDNAVPQSGSTCCINGGTYFCSSCPSGSSVQYEWGCCRGLTIDYCDDCRNSNGLVCVKVIQTNLSCT